MAIGSLGIGSREMITQIDFLQLTHGLQCKDSVKGYLIVAVTKAPETRDNLRISKICSQLLI